MTEKLVQIFEMANGYGFFVMYYQFKWDTEIKAFGSKQ